MQHSDVAYHYEDFDFDEWATLCEAQKVLPDIDEAAVFGNQGNAWNYFYDNHTSGTFFKKRTYLAVEFREQLERVFVNPTDLGVSNSETLGGEGLGSILEVGCGHGSSLYSLLPSMPSRIQYVATDVSSVSLNILKSNSMFDPERVSTLQWDVSEEPLNEMLDMKHEIVLSIFALSAVHPDKHRKSFENMAAAMKDGAYLLFRDYGIHDMTMYRHRVRLGQSLFLRNDNTISYYFDLASLAQTVELAGLQVIELSYACVYNKNRKTGDVMRRVFVHGVFIKLPAEA